MHKPSIVTGIIASVLLALPFVAVLYLLDVLLMVSFPPFDLFDYTARVLPGDVLTFGIDLMVDTIRALDIGRTDTVAKLAEQTMAVMIFTGIAIVNGIIFFVVAPRLLESSEDKQRDLRIAGVVMGLVFLVPLLAIHLDVNSSATASRPVIFATISITFILWGLANGWVYARLTASTSTEQPEASVTALNRRQFLVQLGGSAATVTVIGAGLSALINDRLDEELSEEQIEQVAASAEELLAELPNANAEVMPAPGTRPEYTPLDDHYRIDISSGRPPQLDAAEYVLPITGLVENPVELTLDQIQNDWEPMNQFITMSCISNRLGGDLISTTLWTGISMQHILDLVQPTEEATHIKITAADGFDEFVDLNVIREDETVMLTYAWDNQPLRVRHGFPLRIHIPDRFGMKQPKWITGMEFVPQWEEGYWVRRGWSEEARAVTTSVIDTIAADMMIIDADTEDMRVPIGGIAWGGNRGISKVEVRVNQGEWQETQVRAPLSDRTWVIWRYDWSFSEGNHIFEVRCVDGEGTPQIESERGVRPDGATGIHEDKVSL